MKQWLTMGIENIDKDKWIEVSNNSFNKPYGGLWACEYKPNNEFKSDWLEWCDNEMPNWTKNYGVVFELKDDTIIYTINTYEDLEKLYNKYPKESNLLGFSKLIDFEKASKDYDVIFLTNEGQWATRFGDINLYGWDIECILIMNFDYITNSKYIEF